MVEEEGDANADRFYNVERVKEVFESQSAGPPPSTLRLLRIRIRRVLDSLSGLVSALIGIPIVFGGFFAVIVGVLYGPFVFLATIGSTIGLLALYLQRRVGKSIQFGDFSITRSLIAQLIGLALAVGVLVFLVFLNKPPLP